MFEGERGYGRMKFLQNFFELKVQLEKELVFESYMDIRFKGLIIAGLPASGGCHVLLGLVS